MKRQFVNEAAGLPKWSNPISHAVVTNNLCFISGQLSVDSNGNFKKGSVIEEAKLAFKNVFSTLKAAGFKKSEVVFVDIAFSDLNDLEEVNKLYIEYFPQGRRPARTVYEVARLPFDGKIKITATAVRD